MSNPATIFRALDSSGDWEAGQGLGSYASGEAAIDLDIETALLMFKGDAFWAADEGVDWINLLGNKGTEPAIDLAVRQTIASRDGVTAVTSVDSQLDRPTRKLSIQARTSTIYSQSAAITAQVTI